MRREVSMFCTKKREKKGAKREINKIMVYTSYSNHAYLHALHGYYSKCVNIHSFRKIDVEDFWDKMCKICCFFFLFRKCLHLLMWMLLH